MRLPAEFIRLPLTFDAARLAAEVAAVDAAAWRPHPQGHPGNSALPLVAAGGDPNDDSTKGPMRPTPHLAGMPYVRQVLASLGAVVGRTRLMRIDGAAEATAHVDINYYWVDRVRVHVPITTQPSVRFVCGEREAHMAAGEAWIFDTWRRHNVLNPGDAERIHLVIDTVGSAPFWELVERGDVNPVDRDDAPVVGWDPTLEPELLYETVNHPVVMAPAEVERLVGIMTDGATGEDGAAAALSHAVDALLRDWRSLWTAHGDRSPEAFRPLVERARTALRTAAGRLTLPNRQDVVAAISTAVLDAAVNPELAPAAAATASAPTPRPERRPRARQDGPLARPVFIVSPPRSGSTLLFETLAQSPGLVTIGGESHGLIEGVDGLHPRDRGWTSNRLSAADATPEVVAALRHRFAQSLRDRDGNTPDPGVQVTLLEKTPKNALRIPFLTAAFPEARFVYLYRDPIDTLASMVEGWRSGRFTTYPDLPEWDGLPWSFLLTEGWQDLRGLAVAEVAARQWSATVERMVADLRSLPAGRTCVVGYGRLIAQPQDEIERLCEFLELPWDRRLETPLPTSRTTLTPPEPDKWKRLESELTPVLPIVAGASELARDLFADAPGRDRASEAISTTPLRPPHTQEEIDAGFRSHATTSFPRLLGLLSSSVLVSTYQTGRLIVLREQDGDLNTHLRAFDRPMGVTHDGPRLVIGTRREVWEYRDQPAVARKIEPAGSHDACYLPRAANVTGDLRIHDVAIDGDGELWLVNTAFSCLATVDAQHSFVPRWQPWFVSELAPEDRCHLNGLAVVDGEPRYVTALGMTDTPGGWREHKTTGGVVIDVQADEVIARGLSMPHSPRWHAGKLWVLESGRGALCTIDPASGELTTVAELPGFTRGLSFAGPYAFVGLSQVRETLFDGVPVKERPDLGCGVWVVDTRNGEVAAFLRFEGLVQEIFDIEVLPGVRFPDIAEFGDERVASSYVVPDTALAGVPAVLRG